MRKKVVVILFTLLSLSLSACSNKGLDNTSTNVTDNTSGNNTSISSNEASSVSDDTIINDDDLGDSIDAVPVDEEEESEPKVNEAFKADYDSLEGDYFDEYSERATMTIESFGMEVKITVSWSASDTDYSEWEMTATLKDNRLEYTNCMCMFYDCTNPDDPLCTVVYMDASGYFEIKDGKLLWTGAKDDYCQECIFSKPN